MQGGGGLPGVRPLSAGHETLEGRVKGPPPPFLQPYDTEAYRGTITSSCIIDGAGPAVTQRRAAPFTSGIFNEKLDPPPYVPPLGYKPGNQLDKLAVEIGTLGWTPGSSVWLQFIKEP